MSICSANKYFIFVAVHQIVFQFTFTINKETVYIRTFELFKNTSFMSFVSNHVLNRMPFKHIICAAFCEYFVNER